MTPSDLCYVHQDGSIKARLTPWDRRALGFITAEITSLRADTLETTSALLEQAETWAHAHDVKYLFGRVPADARHVRQALSEHGHSMVECSLTLARDSFVGLPALPSRMLPHLRASEECDMPELQAIAAQDFHHGRFLEDPNIVPKQAAQRTINWINDLHERQQLWAAISNGNLIGFHAERVNQDGKHAELILTGTSNRYAMLTVPLWVSALQRLAEHDVTSCSTLVSAANTGVINLYAKLGFRYTSTLFGYRKLL